MNFTLTIEEYQMLLMALGTATGAVSKTNPQLARAFLRLANRVNENNPAWRPYGIPPDDEANQ